MPQLTPGIASPPPSLVCPVARTLLAPVPCELGGRGAAGRVWGFLVLPVGVPSWATEQGEGRGVQLHRMHAQMSGTGGFLLGSIVWEAIFPACHGPASSFVPWGLELLLSSGQARASALVTRGLTSGLVLRIRGCPSGASNDTVLVPPRPENSPNTRLP